MVGMFKPASSRYWSRPALFLAAVLAAWLAAPAATAFAAPAVDRPATARALAAPATDRSAVAVRPLAAAAPDPFNGAIPGDVSNGQGLLQPVNNPPGSGPIVDNAMPGANPTQTRFGQIDDVDRLFLVRVRQAGLWERPTCLHAQQQAGSERVKDICRTIAADHQQLDEEVRFVAQQLNVALPNIPTPDQQAWMREYWLLRGHEFDVSAVKWMRFAHGGIYTAIASVRASSRNEMMRLYAERANVMVNRHMSLLENTGLVQYDSLPHAAIGVPAVALAAAKVPEPKDASMFQLPVVALVVVAGLLALVSVRRVVRGG
jgi:predicted outer membrane protein